MTGSLKFIPLYSYGPTPTQSQNFALFGLITAELYGPTDEQAHNLLSSLSTLYMCMDHLIYKRAHAFKPLPCMCLFKRKLLAFTSTSLANFPTLPHFISPSPTPPDLNLSHPCGGWFSFKRTFTLFVTSLPPPPQPALALLSPLKYLPSLDEHSETVTYRSSAHRQQLLSSPRPHCRPLPSHIPIPHLTTSFITSQQIC